MSVETDTLCPVEIDVPKTFESGALYHWWKRYGWYETTVGGGFLRVRDADLDGGFIYKAEAVEDEEVARFLGLRDDLGEVRESFVGDGFAEGVFEKHHGLRIPREDFFASVVSFVASAQSRNERTRGTVRRLCEEYGKTCDGWHAHTFPSPETVASLSEDELRGLGFGYRAPYIIETARLVSEGEVCGDELRTMPYEVAHDELKRLRGVGDKVADCVLLFSLGFTNVVALDTWLNRIVDEQYPELRGETYDETARAFRDCFGEYAGYAQTYMYHHARTNGLEL